MSRKVVIEYTDRHVKVIDDKNTNGVGFVYGHQVETEVSKHNDTVINSYYIINGDEKTNIGEMVILDIGVEIPDTIKTPWDDMRVYVINGYQIIINNGGRLTDKELLDIATYHCNHHDKIMPLFYSEGRYQLFEQDSEAYLEVESTEENSLWSSYTIYILENNLSDLITESAPRYVVIFKLRPETATTTNDVILDISYEYYATSGANGNTFLRNLKFYDSSDNLNYSNIQSKL